MRALSIRQPWAWLIVNGYKAIENRAWTTEYRGPLLIHAGLTLTPDYWQEVQAMVRPLIPVDLPGIDELQRGGVVGLAQLVRVVSGPGVNASPWFTGPHGLVLERAQPLPFLPWPGKQGFFHIPEEKALPGHLRAGGRPDEVGP